MESAEVCEAYTNTKSRNPNASDGSTWHKGIKIYVKGMEKCLKG